MPLLAIVFVVAVMAIIMVGQGVLASLGNAFSYHPIQTALGVAAAVVFVASAVWVSRSRSREPVFLGVLGLLLVGGWFATYDTNDGRGMFGVNIAPTVYEKTGLAYGSFAGRLEKGARRQIAYAEKCAAAIRSKATEGREGCRSAFPDGVDGTALAKLKAATDNRNWKDVENSRRRLGDERDTVYELWRIGSWSS